MNLEEEAKKINRILAAKRDEISLSFIEEDHRYFMKDKFGVITSDYPSMFSWELARKLILHDIQKCIYLNLLSVFTKFCFGRIESSIFIQFITWGSTATKLIIITF